MSDKKIPVIPVISLKEWFQGSHTDNEKRELFLYVDFAMKYVHERGYCVKTFNPKEIEILNNSINQVKFNTLLKMYDDNYNSTDADSYTQKLIDEDIFNSSALQILLYSKFPLNTSPQFLKEHFDDFTTFLPETDIPYYRGVIERGASVYFTEYELERVKRENEALEKELKELSNNNNQANVVSLTKRQDLSKMFSNDKINNVIYKKINGLQDSAYLYILLYPTVFIVLALVFVFIVFIIKQFN